jgi:hypothetical protein
MGGLRGSGWETVVCPQFLVLVFYCVCGRAVVNKGTHNRESSLIPFVISRPGRQRRISRISRIESQSNLPFTPLQAILVSQPFKGEHHGIRIVTPA